MWSLLHLCTQQRYKIYTHVVAHLHLNGLPFLHSSQCKLSRYTQDAGKNLAARCQKYYILYGVVFIPLSLKCVHKKAAAYKYLVKTNKLSQTYLDGSPFQEPETVAWRQHVRPPPNEFCAHAHAQGIFLPSSLVRQKLDKRGNQKWLKPYYQRPVVSIQIAARSKNLLTKVINNFLITHIGFLIQE